jgi:transcriptional regulator with XRE-family HTH domain
MLVGDVEEQLRKLVRQRIEVGLISGSELARQTGFRQAHISNFLNRRRGLSVEALDRILKTLGITISDLLPESDRGATSSREFDEVPLVSQNVAHYPDIPTHSISDFLKFKRSFLRRIRPNINGERSNWTRYILLRASAETAFAMSPRITSGATMLIDRHYNSFEPYRRREPSIFAVHKQEQVLIRFVELHPKHLLLRPANSEARLDTIALEGRHYSEHLIGRVCYLGMEI